MRILQRLALKTNIGWSFIWNNNVCPVEIVSSEVAWLSVIVKCAEDMRVLRNYFEFVLVKCKSYQDQNLFLG